MDSMFRSIKGIIYGARNSFLVSSLKNFTRLCIWRQLTNEGDDFVFMKTSEQAINGDPNR